MRWSAMLRTGLALALIVFAGGCSDDDDDVIIGAMGGAHATGGRTGTGGKSGAVGGKSSAGSPGTSGGADVGGSGVGGTIASGGVAAGGGSTAGGSSTTGGVTSNGGTTNAGGTATSAAGEAGRGGTAGNAGNAGSAGLIITTGGTSTTGGVTAGGASGAGAPATGGAASGGAATGGSLATGGTTIDVGGTAGTAGSTDVGEVAGMAGAAGSTAAPGYVWFVKQTNGTTTASMADRVITVSSNYGTSGNAFKYVTGVGYYGTNSNGFIAFPTTLAGDFSIEAQINVVAENKANNACGIGVGLTTGFSAADAYAYSLMRNNTHEINGYYVNSAISVSAGDPKVSFSIGTPMQVVFSRTGNNLTYGGGPVGATPTTNTANISYFTNGTTVYGGEAVYPTISFNNVNATITKMVVRDATGSVVYDSDTGSMVPYTPASLTLSSSAISIILNTSTSVTATAIAAGSPTGTVSTVTAVATDPTIVSVGVVNNASNSTINLTGLKGGTTTVTVTNVGDSSATTNTKTFTVTVNDFPLTDPYGSLATAAYPVPGATSAYADGELALTFDSPPTLNTGGVIKIYRLSDGTEVDSIAFANETQTFGTTTINVGSQLVRIAGSTLYVTPHLGRLAYGTQYYVGIPITAITGTLNGTAFAGLSNLSTVATWNFTTRAAPTLDPTNITVDGSQASTANFRTIQGALSAMATTGNTSVVIHVAPGTYNELLRYVPTTTGQTVRIVGPSGNARGDNCVVSWANGNSMNGSTHTRASFYFTQANLILENMTFRNTGVRSVVAQAETLYYAGGSTGTMAAHNCSFISNQDTIQTSGRNWFYDCYIEGNVDFVWGTADAALFEGCDLRVLAESSPSSSYSMIVARTGATIGAGMDGTVGKGYVVWNSTATVDAGMNTYLGRDAGAGSYYDQVAFINVAFNGSGSVLDGLWNVGTIANPAPYLYLEDASYVGWKSSGCTIGGVPVTSTAANTSLAPAGLGDGEFSTRDAILNRVVTVTAGLPVGFQAAATSWDVSSLATAWGAP